MCPSSFFVLPFQLRSVLYCCVWFVWRVADAVIVCSSHETIKFYELPKHTLCETNVNCVLFEIDSLTSVNPDIQMLRRIVQSPYVTYVKRECVRNAHPHAMNDTISLFIAIIIVLLTVLMQTSIRSGRTNRNPEINKMHRIVLALWHRYTHTHTESDRSGSMWNRRNGFGVRLYGKMPYEFSRSVDI